MKLLVIDNYDSFTYNLVQYFGELGANCEVLRNDEKNLDDIVIEPYDGLVISPGPCNPDQAGISLPAVKRWAGQKPLLGVCLGHQCIGQAFGGKIVRATRLMHGKTSSITTDGQGLFGGVSSPFAAMRYHSLAVSPDDLPTCLQVSAESEDKEIMGIRHREFAGTRNPLIGVQFHPESIMTAEGKQLLNNFLTMTPPAED